MKAQSNTNEYRASFVQRRHSPRSSDMDSSSSCSSSDSSDLYASSSRHQSKRPPLRRTSPKHAQRLPILTSNTEAIAFERDLQNLLEVEYRNDVQEYMYDMEARTTASVELIDQQPELEWYMRPYLIDFLIEIHQQHALRSETLYLAVNIVDRYVSKRIVFKKHYQLVGCAALWIAAKFEDAKDRVPTVQELASACCHAYEESAFIQMEGHVLSTIGWILGHPTPEAWLRLASVGYGLEEQRVQHLSRFLMEITLFHRAFVPFRPSDIAVACLVLARYMTGKNFRHEYQAEQVMRIVQMLDAHLAEHLDQVSAIVVRKYSFAFYSRSSTFAREWYLSGHRFSLPAPTPEPSLSYLSSPISRTASSNFTRSSTPLTSPSSDGGFDSCDGSSDCDDCCEPLTPITPLSTCSLVDPMDCTSMDTTPMYKEDSQKSVSHNLWQQNSFLAA